MKTLVRGTALLLSATLITPPPLWAATPSTLHTEEIAQNPSGLEELQARMGAIEALGQLRDAGAVGPLSKALRDENPSVRGMAAKALGQIGAPAVGPLIEALGDENPNVRGMAAKALGQIGRTLGADRGQLSRFWGPKGSSWENGWTAWDTLKTSEAETFQRLTYGSQLLLLVEALGRSQTGISAGEITHALQEELLPWVQFLEQQPLLGVPGLTVGIELRLPLDSGKTRTDERGVERIDLAQQPDLEKFMRQALLMEALDWAVKPEHGMNPQGLTESPEFVVVRPLPIAPLLLPALMERLVALGVGVTEHPDRPWETPYQFTISGDLGEDAWPILIAQYFAHVPQFPPARLVTAPESAHVRGFPDTWKADAHTGAAIAAGANRPAPASQTNFHASILGIYVRDRTVPGGRRFEPWYPEDLRRYALLAAAAQAPAGSPARTIFDNFVTSLAGWAGSQLQLGAPRHHVGDAGETGIQLVALLRQIDGRLRSSDKERRERTEPLRVLLQEVEKELTAAAVQEWTASTDPAIRTILEHVVRGEWGEAFQALAPAAYATDAPRSAAAQNLLRQLGGPRAQQILESLKKTAVPPAARAAGMEEQVPITVEGPDGPITWEVPVAVARGIEALSHQPQTPKEGTQQIAEIAEYFFNEEDFNDLVAGEARLRPMFFWVIEHAYDLAIPLDDRQRLLLEKGIYEVLSLMPDGLDESVDVFDFRKASDAPEAWWGLLVHLVVLSARLERQTDVQRHESLREMIDSSILIVLQAIIKAFHRGEISQGREFLEERLIRLAQTQPALRGAIQPLLNTKDVWGTFTVLLEERLAVLRVEGRLQELRGPFHEPPTEHIVREAVGRLALATTLLALRAALGPKTPETHRAWDHPLDYVMEQAATAPIAVLSGIPQIESLKPDLPYAWLFQLDWLDRMGEAGVTQWAMVDVVPYLSPLHVWLNQYRAATDLGIEDLVHTVQDYLEAHGEISLRQYLRMPSAEEPPEVTRIVKFFEEIRRLKRAHGATVAVFGDLAPPAPSSAAFRDWVRANGDARQAILGSVSSEELREFLPPSSFTRTDQHPTIRDYRSDKFFPIMAIKYSGHQIGDEHGWGDQRSSAVPMQGQVFTKFLATIPHEMAERWNFWWRLPPRTVVLTSEPEGDEEETPWEPVLDDTVVPSPRVLVPAGADGGLEEQQADAVAAEQVRARFREAVAHEIGAFNSRDAGSRGIILDGHLPGALTIAEALRQHHVPVAIVEQDEARQPVVAAFLDIPVVGTVNEAITVLGKVGVSSPLWLTVTNVGGTALPTKIVQNTEEALRYLQEELHLLSPGSVGPLLTVSVQEAAYLEQFKQYQ